MATDDAARYDALVIGTGQGGPPLAASLAGAGYRTAIVERDQVGGSCVNTGCTPTKTLIASGRVAYQARRAPLYGIGTEPVRVHMHQVRQRKRDMVEQFRSGARHGLERAEGLDLIMGEARFSAPDTVDVDLHAGGRRTLRAPLIVVDTGTRPAVPGVPGLDAVPFLDSTSIQELEAVPEHLLVLGGGYVGLEFAQLFRRLGSAVTIIQRDEQLAPRESPDVAGELTRLLREDGIEVLLHTDATGVEPTAPGVALGVDGPGGARRLTGSHLLVAVGRSPNTEALDLPAAGVETDARGFIRVNDQLVTSVPGIRALGDVTGAPQFTHVAYDHFRILRTNLLEDGAASTRHRPVPYTIFTDPQLGRVGLTEQQARGEGRRIRVARLPMSAVARALETGHTRGFMKAVVDADSDRILGCAILGEQGGEVMSMIQIAMMGDLPYTALRDGVFAHPTLAEALNNLFTSFQD